jgi:hypothetical protein
LLASCAADLLFGSAVSLRWLSNDHYATWGCDQSSRESQSGDVNAGSETVTPISVATGKAGPAIKVGPDPVEIAIVPGTQ